jgi:hypothetical protein
MSMLEQAFPTTLIPHQSSKTLFRYHLHLFNLKPWFITFIYYLFKVFAQNWSNITLMLHSIILELFLII